MQQVSRLFTFATKKTENNKKLEHPTKMRIQYAVPVGADPDKPVK